LSAAALGPFGKRAGTTVHESEPFNSEPPLDALAESSVTRTDAFYVRNHAPVPDVDPGAWRLRVSGLVERELDLGLADLADGRFGEHELVATLQCAGNRRAGLMEVRDIPGESPWGPGATGTAVWSGVQLSRVLDAAGVLPGAHHVAFVGADPSPEVEPPEPFGGSIPLLKAVQPEVLLAWSMNGEPLADLHGAPLRAVVPGYIGARSVKWLERVEVRADPWPGFFQSTAYRLLPPEGEPAPGAGVALGEVAVNAAVLSPRAGDRLRAGPAELRGYAFAGGERHVARVDVSIDGGQSWREAELLEDLGRWAWRMWRLEVDLPPGQHDIVARAWDSAAATQPESAASLWNPKGYVNNAWSRLRVVVLG
jgi:sulfite oxidase